MGEAIVWALNRKDNLPGTHDSLNVGCNDHNFNIIDIAELIRDRLGGVTILVERSATTDNRSYRVSFDKYAASFDGYKSIKDMSSTIDELLLSKKYYQVECY